jgi:hypothetical protein
MKQFLRILFAQLLAFITIGAFAQTPQEQWSTAGTYSWICPAGVTSITLYLWSAGGAGGYNYSGAGGNMVHSTAIPVAAGHTYQVLVGAQVNYLNYTTEYSNSGFRFSDDSTIVAVYGPYFQSYGYGAPFPAPAWPLNGTSPYVYSQHIGGQGVLQWDGTTSYGTAGGGGAASDCNNGLPGSLDGTGGASIHCSGGFWGGDGGNYGQNGPATASGAGGGSGFGYTTGGPALVLMYYTCSAGTTGAIGNAQTI